MAELSLSCESPAFDDEEEEGDGEAPDPAGSTESGAPPPGREGGWEGPAGVAGAAWIAAATDGEGD